MKRLSIALALILATSTLFPALADAGRRMSRRAAIATGVGSLLSSKTALRSRPTTSSKISVSHRLGSRIALVRRGNGLFLPVSAVTAEKGGIEHAINVGKSHLTLRTNQINNTAWRQLVVDNGRGAGTLLSIWQATNGHRRSTFAKTASWTKKPNSSQLNLVTVKRTSNFFESPDQAGAYIGDGVNFLPYSEPGTFYQWSGDAEVKEGSSIQLGNISLFLRSAQNYFDADITVENDS